MDNQLIINLLTIILGLLSTFLGGKWIKTKNMLRDITTLSETLAIALRTLSDAIEDDKITQEEEKKILEEWRDIIEEGKKLVTDVYP